MFNITILKMKDIIKYSIGFIFTVCILVVISKYFTKSTKENKVLKNLTQNSYLSCFEETMPINSNIEENKNNKENEQINTSQENIMQSILKTQISTIKGIENIEEKAKIENEIQETQENNSENQDTNLQLARRSFYTSNYAKSNPRNF